MLFGAGIGYRSVQHKLPAAPQEATQVNRTDVIRQTSDATGEPIAIVEQVVGAFLDAVADGLLEGNVVNIRAFGKFELRLRRQVTRKNPRTGKPMEIPDKVSVAFLPSQTLKRLLNPG